MERIINKIILLKKIEVFKKIFINNEIDKGIRTQYYCCCCNNKNEINIIPYKTGYPFNEMYDADLLRIEDIINNKLAERTNKNYEYLGKFTINNLNTLYFSIKCNNCKEKYLVVFSYGEKQPGLEMCQISGIWNYSLDEV